MKISILFTALILSALTLSAQSVEKVKKKDVPEKVMSTFNRLYAHVDKADWTKKGSIYEAAFSVNYKPASAYFDSEGSWLNTSFVIDKDIVRTGIPALCMEYLDKKYKTAGITAGYILLSPRGKNFMLIVDPDNSKKTKDSVVLYFAENGAFLREEKN